MKTWKTFGLVKTREYRTQIVKIKIQGKLPAKNLYDYYCKHFEQSCYCYHDCCGCWFSGLVYIKRSGTTILMKLSYARNF